MLRAFAPFAALAALLLANAIFTPGFATLEVREGRLFGAIIDILQNGSPILLLAVGMTLVIAAGAIDLSVGSVMALSAAVAAVLVTRGQPFAMALVAALGVGATCGLANGLIVSVARLQPVVATLMTLIACRGLAQTLTGDQKVRFEDPAFGSFANGSFLGLPSPLLLVAGAAVVAGFMLRRTVAGFRLQVVGSNPVAAGYCGVSVRRHTIGAYVASGVCAAFAGLLAAGDIKEADVAGCGLYSELDAILAVVIGGTALTGGRARLVGSLLGAIVMQTLTVTLQMRGVITEHTLIVKGAAVLVVTLIQVASRAPAGPVHSRSDLAADSPARRTWLPALAALAALVAAAGWRYHDAYFLSAPTFLNLLNDNAVLGLAAVGAAVVILSGGIDLSVGAVMSLASIVLATLLSRAGWPLWAALPATLASTTLFGALQGIIIERARLPAFIVTLAGMFMARGLAFVISLEPVSISGEQHEALAAAIPLGGGRRVAIGAMLWLAASVIAWLVLAWTRFGRRVYALGGSETASRAMGVPVARTRVAVYGVSGLCAGLGGVALTAYLSGGSHFEGVGLELDAIAAVAIGGTLLAGGVGSVAGSVVGVLILGLVVVSVTTYEPNAASAGSTKVITAGLLLAFVLLQRVLSVLSAHRNRPFAPAPPVP
ncbi:Inner membrane ABC transporter permease protein YjfF [Phycisphaerales bacterium]|nr:Inner membrane ABC transporter permease protein YjfF [Phycisphaerales bacterium]